MREVSQQEIRRPAGFWLRLCAISIDLIVITLATVLVVNVSASFGWYFPMEITVTIAYVIYSTILTAYGGVTLGKWLCSIRVERCDSHPIGSIRSAIRALVVTASLGLLGLPFLPIAFWRSKRGLQDKLAGTWVRLLSVGQSRRRWTAITLTLLFLGWVAPHLSSSLRMYHIHRAFLKDTRTALNQRTLLPEATFDADSVDDAQIRDMTSWLAGNARDPVDYLVDFAKGHQVTIVGEHHGKVQFLEFLNNAIDRLYHEAGVRVIALECCRANQDASVHRLVMADDFDSNLALAIARAGPWRAWGYKEHWDVLESIWWLNRSLPAGAEPMRVVGIFPSCDLISFRFVKAGGIWRLFRVLDDLPKLAMHDAHYAHRVERQAFYAKRRTLVWVGAAHSVLCCSHQIGTEDAIKRYFRMGAMLRARYGDQVGTILLHGDFLFPSTARLIERCLNEYKGKQAGFDVHGGPIASVVDRSSFYARWGVNLPLGEFVSGYVVVASINDIKSCDWWEGFISPRMFGLNKPFYELLCQRKLKDHIEANRYMQQGVGHL